MARTHSHQEALSESLQAGGGLGQFRAVAERPKEARDSPFGPPPERGAPKQVQPIVKHSSVNARPDEQTRPNPSPPKPQPPIALPAQTESPGTLQVESFTEKVSVPLTRALRDRSEELAKLLNRSRTIRKSRITSNSIIRVALEIFLDSFVATSGHAINSEEDLLKAARTRTRR